MTKTNEKARVKHSLVIRTFGNFECFIDGLPARFRYTKTKELLAYLIDRKGAMVTDTEIRAILWKGEKGRRSYIKNLKADLIRVFSEADLRHVIISYRGLTGVAADRIDCDLFDLTYRGKPAFGAYWGEYMSQYSWGEYTRRNLDRVYDTELASKNTELSPT